MKSHVGCQNNADHQLPHGNVGESRGPVPSQNLREGSAMEGFEHRAVIVQLRQRCVELDKKDVVDARMTNVVSHRRDYQGESMKGREKLRNRSPDDLWWIVRFWERRNYPDRDQEDEGRLDDVASVSEVVVYYKRVIDSLASKKERQYLCWRGR